MKKLYFILIVVAFSGIFNYSNAQDPEKLGAFDYLLQKDYNHALEEFLKLYSSKKTDIGINFDIGLCYLNINDDRSKALPYLEFCYNKGGYKDELLLNLGLANMYAYKFDDAIKFFNEYRKTVSSKKYEEIDHYIENCESAKELIKHPVNVTFENLGKEINSKYPDYYPFVTRDQSTLYFTTRRESSQKLRSWHGLFTSDIYFSKVANGQWTKAKSIGSPINTPEDEECVYLSPDGDMMILYLNGASGSGDLFITTRNPKTKLFSKPIRFNEPVNSSDLELEGYITEDGTALIVSSNRPGGLGETDLYMFRKLPNGEWGLPVNLGPNVNTKYKESFPVFDEKDNVLYFASEGHTNMGGSDIFKSMFDTVTHTFGPAINMGYPINTPEDNIEFTLAANLRDGYISAVRKGGYGDLDIYKVIFNDVESRSTIISGKVSISDTSKKNIDALITVLDTKTNVQIESKNANPQTGKYVFAVNPGTYVLIVTSPGYEDFKEKINVLDKSDYVFQIEKNIVLHKPGEISAPVKKTANQKGNTTVPVKKK